MTNGGIYMKTKNVLIVSSLLIVLFVGLVWFNQSQKSAQLEGLPNYTEIKGTIQTTLNYDKQPYMGLDDAKVKVVIFGDYKCPACKNWEIENFDKFKQTYVDTGIVKLYYMNYAFIDRDSIMAASAGEAIAKQNIDSFWQFHRKLFENQGDETKVWATPDFLLEFVKENVTGIDYDKFKKDLLEHTYMLEVKEDYKVAGSLGVNGSPKFLVNGALMPSSNYEELAAVINQEHSK